ncbi:hypothetical protein [Amycolatopsis sp. YIM 10]|uniref:hypothetical protein n=1 Tax=Amycolatopsis sp. YIM 10 TaxID=2653857 RepID=UPI0012900ABF|nr:hypothetical protein [Amycolatopsis sp. YIM 10]
MPAMAWFEGGTNFIRWSAPGQAGQWPEVQVLGDRCTGRGVALARNGDHTYMAWKGVERNIWWSRLRDGSWSPRESTGFRTLTFPVLGRLGDRTFLAFRREERNFRPPSHQQYTIRWAELHGDRWETESRDLGLHFVDENVSLAEHDGRLHMVWRRTFDSRVCHAVFDGTWTIEGPVGNWRTSAVPAVASDGVHLHFAWRRVEDDHIGWVAGTGDHLGDEVVLSDRRAAGGPALGRSADGELVMVWCDAADGGLRWARCRELCWESRQHAFADRHADAWHGVSLA